MAGNVLEKMLGLIVHRSPIPFVLRTKFGIHTFFLRYEIDVLILDEEQKVVDMRPFLKPWRVFVWNPKYSLVVELPAGRIGESKTRIGDQIVLE